MSTAQAARLSEAAELYERMVSDGALKADAVVAMLGVLKRTPDGRKAEDPIPAALVAFVDSWIAALCRDIPRAEARARSSNVPFFCRVREEIAWRANELGWHPKQIGVALGKDRTTILVAIQRFEKRLAADDLLRQRVARSMAHVPEKIAAGGAA